MNFLIAINNIFGQAVAWFSLASLFSLVVLLFLNFKYLLIFFSKFNKKIWLALFFIFIWALSMRLFLPNLHHEIYIDEPWYMETAVNILETGSSGEYFKSIAWPFLLTIVFGVFGVNNWLAIYASIFFGALTVFPLYFFTFLVTQKKYLSLLSPIFFSLLPIHIFWSATAETNVTSIFFIVLSWALAWLYFQDKKYSVFLLALASFAFTAQIRPENYLYLLLFFISLFIFNFEKIKKLELKYFLSWLLLLLALPNLIRVMIHNLSINWIATDSRGVLSGSNWSLENLINNIQNYAYEVFYHQSFLITILGIIGLVHLFKKKKSLAWWFTLLLVSNWLVYFSSWLQTLGGRFRFYLIFYLFFSILSIFGIIFVNEKILKEKYKKITMLLIAILVYLNYLPFLNISSILNSDSLILETRIPELAKIDIPENCLIILSEEKVIGATTNFETMRAETFSALADPEYFLEQNDCVLFYEDLFCFREDGLSTKEICDKIKTDFDLEIFKAYSQNNSKYNFYKINGRK